MPRAWTKQTDRKKKQFLEALRETGTVTHACEVVGVGRSTVYQWRDEDPEFAQAWDDVIEAMVDALEREAYKRAIAGSDTLLIFLLKGNRPDKYSERVKAELEHSGGISLEISIPDEPEDDE